VNATPTDARLGRDAAWTICWLQRDTVDGVRVSYDRNRRKEDRFRA
jgi:hypothetical protein